MTTSLPTSLDANEWATVALDAIRSLDPHGGEVRYHDVLAHIASLSNFPGWDHWGSFSKRGKDYPRAQRAVTLGAGKLKARGIINAPRRGYYALAQSEVARPSEEVQTAPVPEETVTVTLPSPPALTGATEVAVVSGGKGIAYIPKTPTPTLSAYVADEGLRRMAAEQTRCFGSWSSRSDQCNECPLAGVCQQAGMADFAEMASRLDQEYEGKLQEARDAVALASAPPVEAPAECTPVQGYNRLVSPFAASCSGCGKQIAGGESACHIEGRGLFHEDCLPLVIRVDGGDIEPQQ